MPTVVSVDELQEYVGKPMAPSDWVTVTQDQINLFADATNDRQYIHVDQEKAKDTAFGTTIAHGYLTLALAQSLVSPDWPVVENTVMYINYGLNRLRFFAPVKVNSKVRVHTQIKSVVSRERGRYLIEAVLKMEIEGETKPAFIARQLWLLITKT